MNDANRMTNSIEKLTVLRMMELGFEELLGHADEVSAYNEEVQRGLRRKAYAEGFEEGRIRESDKQYFDKAMEEVSKVVTETPQEKRDRIVEKAKADIDGLKGSEYWDEEAEHYEVKTPWKYYESVLCDAQFVVNKEKSTIVALLKGFNTGELYKRGIAKCDPSDCFNVHIGKAIALRRAIEVEVPDEYLNTPQPTEVRVGDVVRHRSGKKFTLSEKIERDWNKLSVKVVRMNSKEYKVIDDSREGE